LTGPGEIDAASANAAMERKMLMGPLDTFGLKAQRYRGTGDAY
jgi:hypothetical protein